MTMNRRLFLAACANVTFAACAQSSPLAAPVSNSNLPQNARPVENADFTNWVVAFQSRARAAGISQSTLDRAFANAGYVPWVVTRDRNQIETTRTFEDYLSIAASDDRVAKGRAAYARNANTLAAIEARYGVDARIVTAIGGLESRYGERRGDIPVISSTATLAFDGRRATFYERQLLAALRILQRGDTAADQMVGSWAGAMGHTQFIPTSFEALAVDFTGDGRRDIWGEDPTDALASTANYLAQNGWRNGLKWGSEAGTGGPAGRSLTPQSDGITFEVTENFDALKTYNNSDFYAIGVGHLADRIGGAGPLQGSFPPDANGLTKADRIAIQRGLTARNYDVGTIDGVLGAKTTAALEDFQRSQGLAVTGIANTEVLARLR
jgi:lytic murein transglycosylase